MSISTGTDETQERYQVRLHGSALEIIDTYQIDDWGQPFVRTTISALAPEMARQQCDAMNAIWRGIECKAGVS